MIPYIHVPDIDLKIITIHPFGILVATGVLVGTDITRRRAKKLGYDVGKLDSFIWWMLGFGFVGGHVFDQIFYHWDELVRRPYGVFMLWESLSSFGGFLGALIGIVSWKYFEWRGSFFHLRAIPASILPFADLVLSVFPIAWVFGRAGCSTVHDHPGALTTADNWLGVDYPLPGREAETPHTSFGPIQFLHGPEHRFDMGLLEMMFTVIVAACFVITWRRKVPTGTYAVVACLAYAPVRFAMDYLRMPEPRGDPRYDLWDMLLKWIHVRPHDIPAPPNELALTPGQWQSVLMFGVGLGLLWKVLKIRASGKDPADEVRVAPVVEPVEAEPKPA
jgi:phosphatidylglycerol:prolipoprotein diacylglycerol transferase